MRYQYSGIISNGETPRFVAPTPIQQLPAKTTLEEFELWGTVFFEDKIRESYIPVIQQISAETPVAYPGTETNAVMQQYYKKKQIEDLMKSQYRKFDSLYPEYTAMPYIEDISDTIPDRNFISNAGVPGTLSQMQIETPIFRESNEDIFLMDEPNRLQPDVQKKPKTGSTRDRIKKNMERLEKESKK